MLNILTFSFVFTIFLSISTLVNTQSCLDGKASPQNALYKECANWKDLACCNNDTTSEFHLVDATWLGFDYHHCGKMSEKCRKRMLQDLCMYECDPYLGSWAVKDYSKKNRTSRFYKIPLCKTDCELWYEDCKEDFTCVENWSRDFRWKNGRNYCPDFTKCQKIKNIYSSPTDFCNIIWDNSFEVTTDTMNCVSFTFPTTENPNKKVEMYYLIKSSGTINTVTRLSVFLLSLFVISYLAIF